ncbi:MAG TPA: serine/threonine-protein kinase, partial [Polyangiaceae bacterium]|nr:serine/threonine-protein kinase [Polyangiaceae bacterium]
AAGGMARVHLGRLVGAVGFSRTVAVKRLHAQYARDPEFVAMFLDEARLAARIRHPNVVTTLDVVATSGEVFLVMEYIDGDSLSELIKAASRAKTLVPPAIAAHVVAGALRGLHAAHEARDEKGDLLGLVHRDVSPQNILVGTDGVARVLDFGVAKAAGRLQTTEEGHIKGKMAYMAPEQLNSKGVTRRTDLFAAGVVLWETLACRRLFQGADPGEIVGKVLHGEIVAPSTLVPGIAPELDAVVLKALARDPADRFDSAQEMATALEQAAGLVSPREVGEWVQSGAGVRVAERASRIAEIERSSSKMDVPEEARRAVLAASAEAAEVFRSDSAADATANIGSGRSQIGSGVDPRNSIPPKRMRWPPYAAGAGLTLAIIAGFA